MLPLVGPASSKGCVFSQYKAHTCTNTHTEDTEIASHTDQHRYLNQYHIIADTNHINRVTDTPVLLFVSTCAGLKFASELCTHLHSAFTILHIHKSFTSDLCAQILGPPTKSSSHLVFRVWIVHWPTISALIKFVSKLQKKWHRKQYKTGFCKMIGQTVIVRPDKHTAQQLTCTQISFFLASRFLCDI